MKTTTFRLLSLGTAFLIATVSVQAQVSYSDFLSPGFSGVTSTDGWFDLNSTNFPGYGTLGTTNNAWPAPIGSNQSGSGDANLDKIAGTSGYLTSASTNAIYSFNSLGTFLLSDATPVSGLSTILAQVSSTGDIGASAFQLDYNGGNQNLAPTYSQLIFSGPVSTSFGPATKYVWAYQWDVSSLGVTDFTATWNTAAPHDLTFGARLDQSNTFSQVVPEPTTSLLVGLGAAAVLFFRRRKSAVA